MGYMYTKQEFQAFSKMFKNYSELPEDDKRTRHRYEIKGYFWAGVKLQGLLIYGPVRHDGTFTIGWSYVGHKKTWRQEYLIVTRDDEKTLYGFLKEAVLE